MDKNILKKMTLEEKASLCSGQSFWTTKPIERFSIASVMMTDGPHGMRKEVQSAGTNIMQKSHTATCFPTAVTTGSSWDVEVMKQVGKSIAHEARAMNVSTVLGPGVNIKRSPLCGRNFEYISEDPFHAAIMGAAYVEGVQNENVGVSLKHFCANNQENLRMHIDAKIDERALREIYLYAFEHIVKTTQPATVMCSYNRLNGEYLSENKRLLTDILRGEWGFKGIVVSDWGAVNNRVDGIKAGLDLEMPANGGLNDKKIVDAVRSGEIEEAELDAVVSRMIDFVSERKANEVNGEEIDFEAHHEIAKQAATKSAVLLKNVDNSLPISKKDSIAVIGKLAKNLRYQGAGSSFINSYKTVSFTGALRNAGESFSYSDGYTLKGNGYNKKLIEQAKETAKGKDKVIVFVGLTDAYECEGFDRTHLDMPSSHIELVNELATVNENIIVVLSGGSPVKVAEFDSSVKAILNMYLTGQAGGEATYDLIYGKVNPSGKLAETYPLHNNDNIVSGYFPMGPRTVEYRESIYVGYRYFDVAQKQVQYPFGFGLSYTKFEYSDLKLSKKKLKEGDELTVKFKIKNIGDVAGEEIAQLYVSDIQSTIFKPKKELKGFAKVRLEAGETKQVSLKLDSRSFSYYNVLISDWHIESGDFEILVGGSSADLPLSATIDVISKLKDVPVPKYENASFYYAPKDKTAIPKEQFEQIYEGSCETNYQYEKGELSINSSIEQLSCSAVGKLIYGGASIGAKIISLGAENPDMITKSMKDMPLRSLTGFSGGLAPQEAVEGIVDLCNGKKGAVKRIIKGFKR